MTDEEIAVVEAMSGEDLGKAENTASAFQFMPVGSLEYRAPEFLIDELIETETLGLIFGDPGCGKSFLAIDLALCIATGSPFHGHSVKQGAAFYIAGEGHNGLARRFAAWGKERGVEIANAPLFVSNRPAQFLDAASAAEVTRAVDGLAANCGNPAVIIIDTLARNFGPGDENQTAEMSQFVAAVDALKAQFAGCAVLIVHHSGHADKQRARGSMALKAALDCEYRVTKNKDVLKVLNTKMKDAEPPGVLAFQLASVDLSDGVSSAVLRQTENVPSEKPLTEGQRLGRETFIEAAAHDDCWTDGEFIGLHRDQWRDVFYAAHTGDNDETKRKAFGRARKDLVERGDFTVSDDVYFAHDEALRHAIVIQRDTGQERDIAGTSPDAEAESSGTDGTSA